MNQTYCPVCSTIVNRSDLSDEYICPVCNLKTQPEEDANEHDEQTKSK